MCFVSVHLRCLRGNSSITVKNAKAVRSAGTVVAVHTPHLPRVRADSKHPGPPPMQRAGLTCWPQGQPPANDRSEVEAASPPLLGPPMGWFWRMPSRIHQELRPRCPQPNLFKIIPLLFVISSLVHKPIPLLMFSRITSQQPTCAWIPVIGSGQDKASLRKVPTQKQFDNQYGKADVQGHPGFKRSKSSQ